ncbi:MAG: hypothetical protein HYW26_04785 [Candidatus Aenigmarchaeota archaeon]|nr:hypothetical protein [Candidatus Aenigmarchaeota archaeon]
MAPKLMRYVAAGVAFAFLAGFGAGYKFTDTRRRAEIENLTHDLQMREYLFREAEERANKLSNSILPARFVEAKTQLPKEEILRRVEKYNREDPEYSLSAFFYGSTLGGFFVVPKEPGVGYQKKRIEEDTKKLSR